MYRRRPTHRNEWENLHTAHTAPSEVSDQIIDDIETIPDQTKLVPLTDNEPSINGIPPEDEQAKAVAALELDQEETTEEDCRTSSPPAEGELVHIGESVDLITGQDSSVVEGEIEEAVEAKMHEEVVSEDPETKEEETGHQADVAEPEMDTTDVEE
ncbi:glutamate-rich protein 5 isoform X2 [Dendropsophus ebraccatus]|uniref:glutamate-rich protein 5 isoform X2 n=1 Tax=Dendropsophus ebraccatus TaxID=150705 RepID=UPI003831D9C2